MRCNSEENPGYFLECVIVDDSQCTRWEHAGQLRNTQNLFSHVKHFSKTKRNNKIHFSVTNVKHLSFFNVCTAAKLSYHQCE